MRLYWQTGQSQEKYIFLLKSIESLDSDIVAYRLLQGLSKVILLKQPDSLLRKFKIKKAASSTDSRLFSLNFVFQLILFT